MHHLRSMAMDLKNNHLPGVRVSSNAPGKAWIWLYRALMYLILASRKSKSTLCKSSIKARTQPNICAPHVLTSHRTERARVRLCSVSRTWSPPEGHDILIYTQASCRRRRTRCGRDRGNSTAVSKTSRKSVGTPRAHRTPVRAGRRVRWFTTMHLHSAYSGTARRRKGVHQ